MCWKFRICVLICLLFSFLILGCGSSSTTPATVSSTIGADIVQKYNFHVVSEPTITSITLPLQFTDANWGLKEWICNQAGYSLIPYAGQSVSLVGYSIAEKWYDPLTPGQIGESLYLGVYAKDQTSICGFLSASNIIPGLFGANDPNVK